MTKPDDPTEVARLLGDDSVTLIGRAARRVTAAWLWQRPNGRTAVTIWHRSGAVTLTRSSRSVEQQLATSRWLTAADFETTQTKETRR